MYGGICKLMRRYFFQILPYVFLSLIVFILLFPISSQGRFLDGDIFYHVKLALLMRDLGVIESFTWLPFTTLASGFVDHHFLYHVLLFPFVKLFDPLIGAWILQWLFVSMIFCIIYLIARRFDFSGSWSLVVSLIPASVLVFIVRMSIPKAIPLSIVWYLGIVYCLVFNRLRPLFVLCFFYVWLYGGWPIAIICSFAYGWIRFFDERRFFEAFKPACVVLVAVVLGLIINPYFPENLWFYYDQTLRIAIFNDTNFLSIGSEWLGFDSLSTFILYMTIPMTILICGVSLALTRYKKMTIKTRFMLIMTILFFIMNVKSRRYVEYFVPSSAILAIFLLHDFCHEIVIRPVAEWVKKNIFHSFPLIGMVLAIVVYGYVSLSPQWLTRAGGEFSVEMYRGAGEWLRSNVFKGDVVGHLSWSEFPLLFYYDPNHRFLSGLDPRFLAYKNLELAVRYNDVILGRITDPEKIRDLFVHDFGARYVVINQSSEIVNANLIKLFQESAEYKEVYKDEFVRVYDLH